MHPDLVLSGVATGRVVLHCGVETLAGKPLGGRGDLLGDLDLDAEVVHHRGLVGLVFEQHEFERELGEGPCGCDLTGAFALTGPPISHHLKVLREAGLVDSERRGTWVYYRIQPELLAQLSAVLGHEAPAPSPPSASPAAKPSPGGYPTVRAVRGTVL